MGFCMRGVETWTRDGLTLRSLSRKTASDAVLFAQDRLLRRRRQNKKSPGAASFEELIAALYADAVRDSAAAARKAGLCDERDAQSKRTTGRGRVVGKHKKTGAVLLPPRYDTKATVLKMRNWRESLDRP